MTDADAPPSTITSSDADAAAPVLLVVGTGFSEGGVEPLQRFFGALRGVDDVAFVAIAHLDASAPSTLRELVSRVTALAVVDAVEGAALLPGHVHIAPATGALAFEDGHIRVVLSNDPRQRIDDGLAALAESFRARAVGVLLSGTGSDGTIGLEGIHRLEGMTMVQDDVSARFEAMPRNAVTTGVVDHVGPPEALAAELVAYAAHVRELARRGPEPPVARIDEVLPEILAVLERLSHQGLHQYKATTLSRRINRRMQILHEHSAEGYLERLRSDPDEAQALLREVLIGVTSFFRDPEAFATLADACIRKLVEDRPAGEQIRVWVPGCATGEEAYSLAMLLSEACASVDPRRSVQIFATDIDDRALAIARKGSYPTRIAESVSRERLDRFFVRRNQRYQVKQELREMCLFSRHNLVSDPPFSRVDLISCRNVLIYLGAPLQQKLLSIFHYALRSHGFLFLGPSENIAAHTELFRAVSPRQRISQRRSTTVSHAPSARRDDVSRSGTSTLASFDRPDLHLVGQRILLDEFAPSYVIVDDQGQILVSSSGVERYLEFTDGMFKNNVVRLARPGLRTALRPALAEAIESRRKVVRNDVVLESGGQRERVGITVQPMPRLGESDDLLMVVFHELAGEREGVRGPAFDADSAGLITQLEDELATTRDELERSILDLESANEELKSSNEELLSMNEELQAANEELESSKEEIQAANEALARSNADLENLMNSSEIATIFLDPQLRVQRFSQPVTAIYNLLPLDIGRPLAHITHNLEEMAPLPELLAEDGGHAELRTRDGRVLVRRVLPYRTPEGLQEGIVLTFTDVTDLRGHARIIREQLAELERAKRDADAANRAKSDFLANMSHEIRTPMSVVLGYADLLLDRISAPEDRACVATIRRNGQFLLRIVNDILDLSKIEAGTLITEHVRFSPGALLLQLRELLDERVRERGVPLRLELGGPIPETIEGDPTRLRQVLVNLVGNAIKFTDVGEVGVRVEPHRARAELQLTVTDTGIGMDEALQGRLFEPFNQADTSNTRRHGGTGLGLAISKRLVDAMGGRIWVTSEPGVGSTFCFTVPTGPLGGIATIDALPERDADAVGESVVRTLAWRTVLLVDDVTDVRNLLKSYLEDAGAQVVEAGDGAAALVVFETLRREHRLPDVVLLDMQMPVLDGYDTARGLRAQGHAKPIIALTAAAMKGDRERCLAAGCDDYLTKPVSRTTLIECVTRHCSDPGAGATCGSAQRGDARQVLLVEDNEDAAGLLASLLENAGYHVRHAATGRAAIALADELTPGTVLLDIGLPDMDGFAVLSRMRELPALAGTVFIALSGHDAASHPWREAGFHHHIEKPGSFARLRELLPPLPLD